MSHRKYIKPLLNNPGEESVMHLFLTKLIYSHILIDIYRSALQYILHTIIIKFLQTINLTCLNNNSIEFIPKTIKPNSDINTSQKSKIL